MAIKREAGRLPGRTDTNPRCHVSAVLLRNGKKLNPNTKENTSSGGNAETRAINKPLLNSVMIHDARPKSSQDKDKTENTQGIEKVVIDLDDEDEESEGEVDIDRHEEINIDRHPIPNTEKTDSTP